VVEEIEYQVLFEFKKIAGNGLRVLNPTFWCHERSLRDGNLAIGEQNRL